MPCKRKACAKSESLLLTCKHGPSPILPPPLCHVALHFLPRSRTFFPPPNLRGTLKTVGKRSPGIGGRIFLPATEHTLRQPQLVPEPRTTVQEGMENIVEEHFKAKQAARDYGRDVRQAWDYATLSAWSHRITAHLIDSPLFVATDTLLCYVGTRPGELDTRPLITEALNRSMRVLVPLTRAAGAMEWSRLERLDDLVETRLGLLEPKEEAQRITGETTGLCVVPGLLFQRDGHRIGFGGGYYDRFLANHSGPTVGLCPAMCFGHHFPTETHDQPVDWVITENRNYHTAQTIAE